MPLHIVLVEPEIPQNTGNIARTCAATGSVLHLVGKLGFSIDDRYLKRAGLDYWSLLTCIQHESLAAYLEATPSAVRFPASTKAIHTYSQVEYPEDAHLIFGKETAGLPEEFIKQHLDTAVRIPLLNEARSLNLSNAVAIIAFEALRQQGFPNLHQSGKFVQE